MKKKFNELTVKELGIILDKGYEHKEDSDSSEYLLANGILASLRKCFSYQTVDTHHLCRTIYPFYYIYKYATLQDEAKRDTDKLGDMISKNISVLCNSVGDIKQTGVDSLTINQWEIWWETLTDKKNKCDTWLNQSLDTVGKSICGPAQESLEKCPNKFWPWLTELRGIEAKNFDVELPDYLSNPSDAPEESTSSPKEPDSMTYKEIKNLLKRVSQIILTGAPGTGKTKVAKELASFLGSDLTWEKPKEEKFPKYKLVQFHPSYDYTDFVEGLRPVEIKSTDKNDSTITFKKVDGIFKHFCRKVVKENEPDKKYFFIIDEINRADLSKVFGELMYCLEKDKRGEENKIDTQYQNLSTYDTESQQELNDEDDVFAEGFYIPENVVIIGTMNDIDRSVESMDMALRRRFTWYEVVVDKDLLNESLAKIFPDLFDKDPKSITELAKRINKFNKSKMNDSEHGLNKHYYISQGQFTDLPLEPLVEDDDENIKMILKKAWNSRVKGLIEEYVRGEYDAEKFVKDCKNAFLGKSPQNKKTQGEENSDQ